MSSNFDDARRIRSERLELIRLVLHLQREFYDLWGRWPNVEEIAALVKLS